MDILNDILNKLHYFLRVQTWKDNASLILLFQQQTNSNIRVGKGLF